MAGATTSPSDGVELAGTAGCPLTLSIAAASAPSRSHSRSSGSMSFSKIRCRSSLDSHASRKPGPA